MRIRFTVLPAISKPRAADSEALLEDSVLGGETVDHVSLLAVHPACDDEDEELKGRPYGSEG